MPLQPLSPSSSLLLNLKEPEGCKPAAQWPGNLTAFNCVDTKTGQAKTGLECETTTNPTWIHRWTGAGAETGNSTLRADVVTEIRQLLPFAAGDQACTSFIISDEKRNTALTFLLKKSNASRQTSSFALWKLLFASAIICLLVSPVSAF